MSVVYGLLGLCVIVIVHETGHFIAGKLLGVEVETFSVGMGPVLLKKKWRGTEWRLSLFPLGGYCGFKGENAFQEAIENKWDEIPKTKGSLYENPIKRIIIAFAGPFFNVIFAFFAFCAIAFIGYTYRATDAKILLANEIDAQASSPAARAGLKSGDLITNIAGTDIKSFNDIASIVSLHPDEEIAITCDRDGKVLTFMVKTDMDKSTASGKIGVYNWIDAVITEIVAESPAQKSNLKIGDKITSVNGQSVRNTVELSYAISSALEKDTSTNKVNLGYIRDGKELTCELDVLKDDAGFLLGMDFASFEVTEKASGFFDGIKKGFTETFDMIALTLKTISYLFKGIDLSNAVSGPVRITVMLGEAAQSGFSAGFREGIIIILQFLSIISISLFIMNLLPIPILDGGIILFALIEAIRGKGVKPVFLQRFQVVGLVIIGLIFVFALSNDIFFLVKN